MTTFTASELIAHAKAFVAADAARMAVRPTGMPRYEWRMQNPVDIRHSWTVRDAAFKTRPQRSLRFDVTGDVYNLGVWSFGAKPRVIEHIDLRAADADQKLSRYEIV